MKVLPDERFTPPEKEDATNLKPALKGVWRGGTAFTIDKVSGKLATSLTPPDAREEKQIQSVHSILYWLDKSDPRGPAPLRPEDDNQFEHWEKPVRAWAQEQGYIDQDRSVIPQQTDDVHTSANMLSIAVQNVDQVKVYGLNENISIFVNPSGRFPLQKASLFINDVFIQTVDRQPFIFRFTPKDITGIGESNTIRVTAQDSAYDDAETTASLHVRLD